MNARDVCFRLFKSIFQNLIFMKRAAFYIFGNFPMSVCTILPVPMFRCPTSELPGVSGVKPTRKPEAASVVLG